MWDDAKFSLFLSKGIQALMAVGLPLVEKVRVLRGYVLVMHREGERHISSDLKNLEVGDREPSDWRT
jgi:hypothetical protein